MKRLGMLFLMFVAQLSMAAEPTTAKGFAPGLHFVKYLGSLEKYIPIKTASLGDKQFGVLFVQSPVKAGKHTLTFTIYDGAATEVRKQDVTVEEKSGRIAFISLNTFNKQQVATGTWTWVAELDGQPQFTETIYVGP